MWLWYQRLKNKRIQILITLIGITALVTLVGFIAFAWIRQPEPIVWQAKGKGLGQGQIIAGQAGTGEYGVRKGDAFPFTLEVMYDITQVGGIDRARLDTSVNLKPFEIREIHETDLPMDAHTRIYRRQYTLQFIDGKADQSYALPTIVVRYQLRGTNNYAEKGILPTPIFVAARLPKDGTELELRPITDQVLDPSRDHFVAVLWAAGGLVALMALVDLGWRMLPQWRAENERRTRIESGDALVQAYRALDLNRAMKAEPKVLLHQIDHLLRLVLAQKEKQSWLQEPNLDGVPAEIRPTVTALFERCQQSYGRNGLGVVEIEQVVNQLDAVLRFYAGDEFEQWKA